MKTQGELLKDMLAKAKKLNYDVRYTGIWIEFYKAGVRRIRFRRIYKDYTIDNNEYDRQMARIK